MLDFPSSPTLDQVFGNYKWNGYAWAPQPSGNFVAKTGDTMTGALNMAPATGGAYITLDPTQAAQQGMLNFMQSGLGKWQLGRQAGSDDFLLFNIAAGLSPILVRPNDNSISLYSTVPSTSPTSGALQVAGGVGVGGALSVGGSINASAEIVVRGYPPHAVLILDVPNHAGGGVGAIDGSVAGVKRWQLRMPDSPPNGDFGLYRYNAAGAFLDVPLRISSADAKITTSGALTVGGPANLMGPVEATGPETILFMDGKAAVQHYDNPVNGITYTVLWDGNWDGVSEENTFGSFWVGGGTDPANYYLNTSHQFAPIAGAPQFANLDATKLDLKQTTPSTSTTTGALTVAGGAGIGGVLCVGGVINANGGVNNLGSVWTTSGAYSIFASPAGAAPAQIVLGGGGDSYFRSNAIYLQASDAVTPLATFGAAGTTIHTPLTQTGAGHWVHAGVGAGSFYSTDVGPDRFFLGTDAAGDNFRLFSSGAGTNLLTINGASGLTTFHAPVTAAAGAKIGKAVAASTVAPLLTIAATFGDFDSVPTIDWTVNDNGIPVARIGVDISNAGPGDLVFYTSNNWTANATVERMRLSGADGLLTLTGDPTAALHAATKQYVDTKQTKATISTSAPSGGVDGDVWYQVT